MNNNKAEDALLAKIIKSSSVEEKRNKTLL